MATVMLEGISLVGAQMYRHSKTNEYKSWIRVNEYYIVVDRPYSLIAVLAYNVSLH